MINRNLSRDVVNGTIGEVVRFEEPDPEKFPFSKNATLMRLWYQKGGKQAVQNYGLLPVVRVLSSSSSSSNASNNTTSNTKNDQDENKNENEHQKQEEQQQEAEVADESTSSSTDSTTSTPSSPVVGVVEYQIPPMFVNIGGSESTSFYQQSSFYLPMQLGFSLTVHKCQGLTILGNVVLDLRELTYKAAHLVYVACSRVRNLEQLRIVGLNPQKHLIVDQKALEFSASLPSVKEVLEESSSSSGPTMNEIAVADWVMKKQ